MEFVKIGSKVWNVMITEISENFSILYSENTGRTMSMGARMTLDPLGTFFGHKVTFVKRSNNQDEYDALYEYLSKPRFDGIPVELPHNQSTLKYDAYVSTGERKVRLIDTENGIVHWDSFSANFIPMEAQVRP